tara:strand:+ start:24707 stop:24913 length:207 start_codon:yes stop_codon:yes gene_type:complete
MARTPAVSRADLDRVIAALQAAGVAITGAEVTPRRVLILTGDPAAVQDSAPVSELDAWREKQRGQGAA